VKRSPILLTKGGGTAYGTFVHEVFRHLDFRSACARDGRTIDALTRDAARRATVQDDAALELAGAMPAILRANLARAEVTLPPEFCLASLEAKDRLDELSFDLALAGGARWKRGTAASTELVSLERVIAAMRGAPDVLPRAWVSDFERRVHAGRLAGGLAGILRGAIDLVFRVAGPRGHRAFVVDYKTNRLPGDSLDSYTREGMRSAMVDGDYLLQALLYTVALHRELRLRMQSYRYDDHVGGFLYLFVRGLGAAPSVAEESCRGVYADRFPEALVDAIDEALRGGS
jgi:exodeoxyribonuclease V beta subunit